VCIDAINHQCQALSLRRTAADSPITWGSVDPPNVDEVRLLHQYVRLFAEIVAIESQLISGADWSEEFDRIQWPNQAISMYQCVCELAGQWPLVVAPED
ncbi:MAG: hypothetical protein KDA99_02615, partial [Planctomycetales bacterium]|nr:hypothetical protein [Planctomycetales bacterium]